MSRGSLAGELSSKPPKSAQTQQITMTDRHSPVEPDADEEDTEMQAATAGGIPLGGVIYSFKKAKRNSLFYSGLLYTTFLAIFVTITMLIRPVDQTFQIQNAIIEGIAKDDMDSPRFEKTFFDMANYGDFWVWMFEVFYGNVFEGEWYNGEPRNRSHEYEDVPVMRYNRLQTAIRLRQSRVERDSCKTEEDNHELSRPCWGDYGTATAVTGNKHADRPTTDLTRWSTDLNYFEGRHDDGKQYKKSGYYVDLPINATRTLEILQTLVAERWVDENTRGIAIEMNTYNPAYDMSTVTRFKVDIRPGGLFIPSIEIFSARLYPYTSSIDGFRAFLELVFFFALLYYFWREGMEMRTEGWRYAQSFWNWVELANLTFFVVIMAYWLRYIGTFGPDRVSFKEQSVDKFQDLYTLTQVFSFTANMAAVNVVFSFVKFFKFLQLNQRMLLIWDVLTHAMGNIIPFMAIFVLITFAFTFAGHWLYGSRVFEFRTWNVAFGYLLRTLTEGIEYETLKNASPGATPLYVTAWIGIVTLVLLNMFIAILTDSYAFVQSRTKRMDELERDHVEDKENDWLLFLRSKLCCCFTPRNHETEKKILQLNKKAREMKEVLEMVDQERLWHTVLQTVTTEKDELSVEDVRPVCRAGHEGVPEMFLAGLVDAQQLTLDKPPRPATTMMEIGSLQTQISALEGDLQALLDINVIQYETKPSRPSSRAAQYSVGGAGGGGPPL
ncbi:unnamed protein product [Vitrella brassicaformis CCMP3155]|uniref:Uncharacterized protein n=2 Tax=Vitrella brassicaformis TaxID=1169539 RepID=A0A0G4FFY7_VITBC|nr:unnamed protein product [Vitrella brassicaformis CCMP3155]|eukprot:CEM12148.1 unnamed protein product [Vitrella brassicaformis CCMP3155]